MDFHQYLYEAPIFSMPSLSGVNEWLCFVSDLLFGVVFGFFLFVFGGEMFGGFELLFFRC
jgi:hypothetical protein